MYSNLDKFLKEDFDVKSYPVNFDILGDSLDRNLSIVICGERKIREKLLSVISKDLIRVDETVILVGDHLDMYLEAGLNHVIRVRPKELSMDLIDLFDTDKCVTLICENLMDNKVKTFLHGISEYIRNGNVRVIGTWGTDCNDESKIQATSFDFDNLQYIYTFLADDSVELIYYVNNINDIMVLKG